VAVAVAPTFRHVTARFSRDSTGEAVVRAAATNIIGTVSFIVMSRGRVRFELYNLTDPGKEEADYEEEEEEGLSLLLTSSIHLGHSLKACAYP
jgi:hypothetical protein